MHETTELKSNQINSDDVLVYHNSVVITIDQNMTQNPYAVILQAIVVSVDVVSIALPDSTSIVDNSCSSDISVPRCSPILKE